MARKRKGHEEETQEMSSLDACESETPKSDECATTAECEGRESCSKSVPRKLHKFTKGI